MPNPLRIACSPLTKRIYAGRLKSDQQTWRSEPTDVTSDVLQSVIEKVGVGNKAQVHVAGVPAYEITITAVGSPPAPHTTEAGR